jgi:hypothetical protein
MKSTELKTMIKEAVKEAIEEELKDILLEAVRASKTSSPPINETRMTYVDTSPASSKTTKEKYASLLNGMSPGLTNISMDSSNAQAFGANPGYNPGTGSNTAGQGSSLPPGEVNMSQIMGLINKK